MTGCDGWTAVAPGWDRLRDHVETMKRDVTRAVLAALEPLDGASVLELGAGTGELAARLAGCGARVLATDAATGMVAVLHARLAGVPNAEVRMLDASRLDLAPHSVDAVVFRMGLMMVPEPAAALEGVRRVLAPGGRFVTSVWGSPQDNPWMTLVGMAAMSVGLVAGGPPVGPGGPFSLADPIDLEKRVRDAGFPEVDVRSIETVTEYADAAALVDTAAVLSPQFAPAFARADADERAAVLATVEGLAARFRVGEVLHVPSRAFVCTARTAVL